MPKRKDFAVNFTIVVLLAFGLGAAALLYTALDRLLLHPLHVSQPESLVRVAERHPPLLSWQWFPYHTFEAMRPMRSFNKLAVEGNSEVSVTTNSGTQSVIASMVSGSYFAVLGIAPELGRTLNQADEHTTTGIPVVLSHRFWTEQYSGAAAAIGTIVFVQRQPFTIVGVMPPKFFGTQLDDSADLWLPLSAQSVLSRKALDDPEPDRFFSILGRLKPGVTPAQAQAEFAALFPAIERDEGYTDPQRQGLIVPIANGSFAVREQFGRALKLLLWGMAGLLLMICASIAGLLLARAARRERDTAVRIALGAGRAHLVRRSLLESAVLGAAGSLGGVALAYLCAPLLARLLPVGTRPLPVSLLPDVRTYAVIGVLAFAISMLFGGIPAWLATRIDPQQALRKGTATNRTGAARRLLLGFEIAVTLVLLVGTGLLLRTLYVLRHTSPGFDVKHLVSFYVDPNLAGASLNLSPSFPETLRQRIASLPGVTSASLGSAPLMHRIGMKTSVAVTGQKIPSQSFLNTTLDRVSSGFFETLGIPLLAGHNFSDASKPAALPVPTVINLAFAHALFPHSDPIGQTFGAGAPNTIAGATNVVIGVVGDSKYRSLREALLPIFYTPINPAEATASGFYVYAHTQGEPASIVGAARDTLADLEPQLPFSHVVTMHEQVNESLWQEQLLAALAILFSVVAVLMAGAGLYGLLSYAASQRTREFGIRSAIGAQRRDIGKLVVREMFTVVAPGIGTGLVACFFFGRIVASLLYGVQPLDLFSLSCSVVAVVAIGMIAVWQPMRRAMQADPAVVLRDE